MIRFLPSLRHLWLLAACALIWLAALGSGVAQGTATSDSFSSRTAIELRIDSARKELADLPASADPALRGRLQQLEAATDSHLATIDLLAGAQDRLTKAKAEASAWNGFPTAPPYSVLLLDQTRESLAGYESERDIAKAQLDVVRVDLETLRDALVRHQQNERRLRELASGAAAPDARFTANTQAQIESLDARIAAERIGRNQLAAYAMQARIDAAAALIELANRQVKAIGDKTVFTRAELDAILQPIESERAEITRAFIQESREQHAHDPLHSWRIQFLDFDKTFWEARFTAINSKDPEEIRKAIDAIEQLNERVETWAKISQLRIAGGDPETGELDPAKLRDAVFQLRSMQRRVGFALADLSRWSLSNRGTPLFDKLVTSLHAIWNTELYVVEESDIVNGEKILFHLPVTVAKLARLALILIVGWWLLRLVSRRVRAVVMRRGKIPEATASLAEKWAFGIGLFLLVLYGLHTVRIPLTAFAFIGGALAIGVGFGTQTILKNFISGIIILFERPLKVGDVVEVANITGTIKQIGMRASVIHHFDGIETLVPNSILLENQLTNWTFSSTVIRHSIIVGVAYGSPTREVARLLLGVATGHGLVKKDPAPEVRFDDFGADSLTFTLLFWLDTRKTGRAQLASDLRYMIDKAFAEAGIVIAYPQRDIHFDPDKPLRVEMTRSAIAGPKKVDPPDPAQGVSP